MGKSAGSWKTMTERAPYTQPYQPPWGPRSFMSPIQEHWDQQPVAGSPATSLHCQSLLPWPSPCSTSSPTLDKDACSLSGDSSNHVRMGP